MIEVSNISFKYAGQKAQVFEDFSLRLEANNIYGLLGKNGTGKSTLLYLVSGLLRPKKGAVRFDGVETCKRLPETLQSERFRTHHRPETQRPLDGAEEEGVHEFRPRCWHKVAADG